MNRDNILHIFQFFLLLFLQSFLLNNINLFGFINPNLYLLFIIIYRLDGNPTLLIIIGFVMGLLLDLLTQGSGGHTIATLTIAFLRLSIIKFSFGVNYDVPMGMIKEVSYVKGIIFYVNGSYSPFSPIQYCLLQF